MEFVGPIDISPDSLLMQFAPESGKSTQPITKKVIESTKELMRHLSHTEHSHADYQALAKRITLRVKEEIGASWSSKFLSAVGNLFSSRVSSAHILLRALNASCLQELSDDLSRDAEAIENIRDNPKEFNLLSRRIESLIADKKSLEKAIQDLQNPELISKLLSCLKASKISIPQIPLFEILSGLQDSPWKKIKSAFCNILSGGLSTPHKALRALSFKKLEELVTSAAGKILKKEVVYDIRNCKNLTANERLAIQEAIATAQSEAKEEISDFLIRLNQPWKEKCWSALDNLFSGRVSTSHQDFRSLNIQKLNELYTYFETELTTLTTKKRNQEELSDENLKKQLIDTLKVIVADLGNVTILSKEKQERSDLSKQFKELIPQIRNAKYTPPSSTKPLEEELFDSLLSNPSQDFPTLSAQELSNLYAHVQEKVNALKSDSSLRPKFLIVLDTITTNIKKVTATEEEKTQLFDQFEKLIRATRSKELFAFEETLNNSAEGWLKKFTDLLSSSETSSANYAKFSVSTKREIDTLQESLSNIKTDDLSNKYKILIQKRLSEITLDLENIGYASTKNSRRLESLRAQIIQITNRYFNENTLWEQQFDSLITFIAEGLAEVHKAIKSSHASPKEHKDTIKNKLSGLSSSIRLINTSIEKMRRNNYFNNAFIDRLQSYLLSLTQHIDALIKSLEDPNVISCNFQPGKVPTYQEFIKSTDFNSANQWSVVAQTNLNQLLINLSQHSIKTLPNLIETIKLFINSKLKPKEYKSSLEKAYKEDIARDFLSIAHEMQALVDANAYSIKRLPKNLSQKSEEKNLVAFTKKIRPKKEYRCSKITNLEEAKKRYKRFSVLNSKASKSNWKSTHTDRISKAMDTISNIASSENFAAEKSEFEALLEKFKALLEEVRGSN